MPTLNTELTKITMQCKAYSKQLLILNTVVLFVINVCQADRLPHTLYSTWNCFDHPRSWHRGPVEQQQKCCNRICWNRHLFRDLEFVLTTLHINANFITHTHTNTYTHPFTGPFSWTTRVSRYQKGETNLDFTEARDSEWQWHQLGCMQVCISLYSDNHASTPPLSFLQAGCPSCRPTNSVKALKADMQTS